MSVREGTPRDVEALSKILIDCSDDDPIYPYRFPHRHNHLREFKRYCKDKCLEYLDTCTVMVYEIPNGRRTPKRGKVIAFSVWKESQTANPAPARRSSHTEVVAHASDSRLQAYALPDRVIAFREASKRAKSDILDARYTEGHMFLKILLCHSEYRGRGAGTALTRWGMNKAQALGLQTTLFASPMGQRLYRRLGFKVVGRFHVQLENETESLDIPAMVYECPAQRTLRGRSSEEGLGSNIIAAPAA